MPRRGVPLVVSGLTFVFGAMMLQSLGDAGAQTRAWRTTATTVTDRLDRSAQPEALLYRVDGAGRAAVPAPALPLAP